jgi:DnaK suppressor protein
VTKAKSKTVLTRSTNEEMTLATAKKAKATAKAGAKASAKASKGKTTKTAAKAGAKAAPKAKKPAPKAKTAKAAKAIKTPAKTGKAPAKKSPPAVKKPAAKVTASKKPVAKKAPAKAAPSKPTPSAKGAKQTKVVPAPAKPAVKASAKSPSAAAPAPGKVSAAAAAAAAKAAPAAPVAPTGKGKAAAVTAGAVPASPTPVTKGGIRPTLVAAAPAAPTVVIPVPTRALPKSMTVKTTVSNVLPFSPKTTRVAGLLSEAEILKQSKDDYMSKDQLAFFKHRLLELAAQLRENAGQTTEHLRELAIVPDPADRATLEEEHALELRARDRERKLLKKVEAALLRIEDGSYGYCEETGDPIGVARLLARPTATLSIEAQERRELKQKMFGE